MPLTPKQVESWLANIEKQFEDMARDLETGAGAPEGFTPEMGEFFGKRTRQVTEKLMHFMNNMLATVLRGGAPIYQKDLDDLADRMARKLSGD
jgi:hypothetical protein